MFLHAVETVKYRTPDYIEMYYCGYVFERVNDIVENNVTFTKYKLRERSFSITTSNVDCHLGRHLIFLRI